MKIELIVPVAPDGGQAKSISNRPASLRGKTIGLLDNDWSSYDVFLDSVERLFKGQAIRSASRIHHPQRRNVLPKSELDALAGQMDTAIVGLGA